MRLLYTGVLESITRHTNAQLTLQFHIFIDRKTFAQWISKDKTKPKDESCGERKKRNPRVRS